MKVSNIKCKIEIFCKVNSSEDPNKIKKAISNIFSYSKVTANVFSISAESNDLNSLEKIYQTIHLKQSQKTYGRHLEQNLENDTTWFYLDKQAAFVENIAICEESEESPLGPIKVTPISSNLDGIIDWLVFGNTRN